MRPESPWEARDAILENNHRTSFEETSAIEIDERFAEEDPDHPDSIEFRRINRERCSEIAQVMKVLLEIMVPDRALSKMSTSAAGNQVIVLLWLLQSSKCDIATMSMATISEKIGCTRALLSYYAKRFEKVFGFHGRGMKGKEASESFIKSSRRGWETRRRRKASTTDPAPVNVGLEEIDPHTADRAPRRFELEDEQEIDASAEGFSFDSGPRKYDSEG